jgi:hypothetical protein
MIKRYNIMIKFSEYLLNGSSLIQSIENELDTMSVEDINNFGEYLYDEYFDFENPVEDDEEEYENIDLIDKEEIIDLLNNMNDEELNDIYIDISFEMSDITEAPSQRMKTTNLNKKKRKFMKKTSAQLRREKIARVKSNRKNKSKRKQYYKKNKSKISKYKKDYNKNVKSGKHTKKTRKNG